MSKEHKFTVGDKVVVDEKVPYVMSSPNAAILAKRIWTVIETPDDFVSVLSNGDLVEGLNPGHFKLYVKPEEVATLDIDHSKVATELQAELIANLRAQLKAVTSIRDEVNKENVKFQDASRELKMERDAARQEVIHTRYEMMDQLAEALGEQYEPNLEKGRSPSGQWDYLLDVVRTGVQNAKDLFEALNVTHERLREVSCYICNPEDPNAAEDGCSRCDLEATLRQHIEWLEVELAQRPYEITGDKLTDDMLVWATHVHDDKGHIGSWISADRVDNHLDFRLIVKDKPKGGDVLTEEPQKSAEGQAISLLLAELDGLKDPRGFGLSEIEQQAIAEAQLAHLREHGLLKEDQ